MSGPAARRYKEGTLQQVRSFCEAARLGSFSAAAASLGLTHPTVWKQVHALERSLGVPLFDTRGRRSRLTAAGQVLVDLAAPAVTTLTGLREALAERLGVGRQVLRVASSPRILCEDLLPAVVAARLSRPDVEVEFIECLSAHVSDAVAEGRADLGFTIDNGRRADQPAVEWRPGYATDLTLILPAGHPLAARRALRPADLKPYPVVNRMEPLLWDAKVFAALARHGLAHPLGGVEALFTGTVRRFVAAGLGVGFSPGPQVPDPTGLLVERSVARLFGRPRVVQVWRRGAARSPLAVAFAADVTRRHATRARP